MHALRTYFYVKMAFFPYTQGHKKPLGGFEPTTDEIDHRFGGSNSTLVRFFFCPCFLSLCLPIPMNTTDAQRDIRIYTITKSMHAF